MAIQLRRAAAPSQLLHLHFSCYPISIEQCSALPRSTCRLQSPSMQASSMADVVQYVHDGNYRGNESGRKVQLQVIPHKSKFYTSNGSDTIKTVF
uniref:Uncharacterized protein n=1 Tax=Oryza punctata TaxID=4537 RepID=A0A0E0JSD8_ORYPU